MEFITGCLAKGGLLLISDNGVFEAVLKPVTDLLDTAIPPLLALVAAIGAIYCVLLGAKLAKAEEPQDREKAKSALKNALVGFLLIFILLAALKIAMPMMTSWYQKQSAPSTSSNVSLISGELLS